MSEDESTGNVRVVSAEDEDSAAADLAAVPDAEPIAARPGTHVITLHGAEGWHLDHPASCPEEPNVCPVAEAAGRISRATCATLGRWQCDVAGGSLMLVERIGD